MNSFKNPLIPLITNPVNIDRPIQEIQVALGAMGWLEKSFGRTWESFKSDSLGSKLITYPEAWQGPNREDLISVMPNDNLKAQSFFVVEDPIEVVEFKPYRWNRMRAKIGIIFWFNLLYIDDTIDYRYTELLKSEAQRVITTLDLSMDASIVITRTWEKADNVFRGFTIDKLKQQELVHPWGGFRLDCDLFFTEDCPDTTILPVTP